VAGRVDPNKWRNTVNLELCPNVIARKQRHARIWVALPAMLSSASVVAVTVLMVTGPAGFA